VDAMRTYDIKKEIRGRTPEILEILGIDERALRRKVHCPLPSHNDEDPSFRVHTEKDRFYCSCYLRGGSMIDLVIKMERAKDFTEAARWLRRNLNSHVSKSNRVKIPDSFIPETGNMKECSDREAILRVLARCVEVPLFHPYILRKGILPIGALFEPILKNIVLPIHDSDYKLQGIEYIDRQNNKFCVDGTKKSGNGLMIGNPDESRVLGVAEGWSTAVSIHTALGGLPILVTFGASNLAAVKNFARQDQDVWFFADNDKTGIESAKRAASLLSQRSSVFTSNLEDFNDDFQAILGDTNFCRIREELHRVRGQK
jgi:phage/plasmid primase-like uncharacterized protein